MKYDGSIFFASFTSIYELNKTFPEVVNPDIIYFYDFCENIVKCNGECGFEGVILNPESQQIDIPCKIMMNLYKIFD